MNFKFLFKAFSDISFLINIASQKAIIQYLVDNSCYFKMLISFLSSLHLWLNSLEKDYFIHQFSMVTYSELFSLSFRKQFGLSFMKMFEFKTSKISINQCFNLAFNCFDYFAFLFEINYMKNRIFAFISKITIVLIL